MKDEQKAYPLFPFEDEGYGVAFSPPMINPHMDSVTAPSEAAWEGKPALVANTMVIVYKKLEGEFDRRRDGPFDPPGGLMQKHVNEYVAKLRDLLQLHTLEAPVLLESPYEVQYLSDEFTEVEMEVGLVRGRGGLRINMSAGILQPERWIYLNRLPRDWEPNSWDVLLLESQRQLPRLGPAVTLAYTALEVFIAVTLDRLAKFKKIDSGLWTWLNDRDMFHQNPSVSDQYYNLLKWLAGVNLKDYESWNTSFKLIKEVRNKFVHEGVASRKNGSELDRETIMRIPQMAREIIHGIMSLLPKELQCPVPEFPAIEVTVASKTIAMSGVLGSKLD